MSTRTSRIINDPSLTYMEYYSFKKKNTHLWIALAISIAFNCWMMHECNMMAKKIEYYKVINSK